LSGFAFGFILGLLIDELIRRPRIKMLNKEVDFWMDQAKWWKDPA
jgi:hypothetical protein